MKLSLGFSTCPNDTFIFDALVHKKVDTEGLEFDVVLADVEELNRNAFEGIIDITKISYHAFAHIADKYKLLNSGSALGYKNGPLLISKRKIYSDEIINLKIAIPGKYTTANLLFSIVFPSVKEKKEYLFSDIEEAVLSDEMDAGVIIHENRFTYAQKGLVLLNDLGAYWETETGLPIPLGGIAVRKSLPPDIRQAAGRVMQRSVAYAFAHENSVMPFVRRHAQAMEDDVMKAHIGLYVNKYTLDLGTEGREAIRFMFAKAAALGLIPAVSEDVFA